MSYRSFGPKPEGETNAEYQRRMRQWAAENGLCYVCRKRKQKAGRRSCAVCLARAQYYKRKWL